MAQILYKDESYAIVGALFDVYNNLGSGFSEKFLNTKSKINNQQSSINNQQSLIPNPSSK